MTTEKLEHCGLTALVSVEGLYEELCKYCFYMLNNKYVFEEKYNSLAEIYHKNGLTTFEKGTACFENEHMLYIFFSQNPLYF